MDYSIFIWEIIIFVLICLISSMIYLNFDYQDTNNFYKLFVPKNDSLWERIKVLIGPSLLMMLLECLLVEISPNFMFSKLISLIVMTLVNPLFFIVYFSFSKWDMIVINVLSTISSALMGLFVSIWVLSISILPDAIIYISAVGIILIIIFYICATFFQTDDMIFMDPITKRKTLKKDN